MRYIWAIVSVTSASTSGGIDDVGQVDDLHAPLFGERLGQLLFVDQAHGFRRPCRAACPGC